MNTSPMLRSIAQPPVSAPRSIFPGIVRPITSAETRCALTPATCNSYPTRKTSFAFQSQTSAIRFPALSRIAVLKCVVRGPLASTYAKLVGVKHLTSMSSNNPNRWSFSTVSYKSGRAFYRSQYQLSVCRSCQSSIKLFWKWERLTETGRKFVNWGVCADCAARSWNAANFGVFH